MTREPIELKVSRRAFLRASGLAGAGVVTGVSLGTSTGFAAASAADSGSLPASKSFLFNSTPTTPLAQNLNPRGNTSPQSFAIDPSTGLLYVAAITGSRGSGTPDSNAHGAAGDITISQMNPDTGQLIASMDLAGCGHGFSIAAVPGASGAPADLWFEFNSKDGYGTCVSHYPFTPTDPDSWSPIPASTLAQHLHNPFPGTVHNSPAYDPVNKRMAIRYQLSPTKANPNTKRVAIFTMAQIRGSAPYSKLAEITLPTEVKNGQGFALYGDYIYFLDGPQVHNDCGQDYRAAADFGASVLARLNVNTEELFGPVQTNAFYDVGRREPEGMAIQIAPDGSPRLCFGINGYIAGSGNSSPYTHCSTTQGINIGYKDTLTSYLD